MSFWPKRTDGDQDWSKYIEKAPTSKKRLLIEECKKRGVTIFVDDPSETAEGVYSHFRAVASEAELESRLFAKAALARSNWSNFIAAIALVVSIAAFIKSFW